ncbi:MAG TPA: DUF4388 domain-containing protein [Thermoanaerobaculia bacterium]|nr:DUF4388 domain-containing protein [Thermoanaerobaculia bacterium]
MPGDSAFPKFQFRSDLAQTPLPEVLATIHRYRVPGVIDCSGSGHIKSIFIDGGNIIFAASTDVRDSLGDRLLAAGRISREQYAESVKWLTTGGGRRQGSILVEMRALEPKDLFLAVRDQVQAIVWSIFEWTEGAVSFEPGRERTLEFIKLNIPTRQAVIQGVRMMSDARPLVSRIGNKATLLERIQEEEAGDLSLQPAEAALLDQVDGRRTLYELTNLQGQSPVQNAKTLYSLFALRVIRLKSVRQLKVHLKINSPAG